MSPNIADGGFIKDADLHAYLDGELAPDAARDVEQRLAADVGARVLVTSLSVQREALATHYPLPEECPVTRAMMAAVLASKPA